MIDEIPKPGKKKGEVVDFKKAREEALKKKEAERLRKLGDAGPESELTQPQVPPLSSDEKLRFKAEIEQPTPEASDPSEREPLPSVSEEDRIKVAEPTLKPIEDRLLALAENPILNAAKYVHADFGQMVLLVRGLKTGLTSDDFVRQQDGRLAKIEADAKALIDKITLTADGVPVSERRGWRWFLAGTPVTPPPTPEQLRTIDMVRAVLFSLHDAVSGARARRK